jgi:PAS domain S-box-containing protein
MQKSDKKNTLEPDILHHDLLKKIIDDSIDGFFVLTDDYKILHFNRAFKNIFPDHELSARDTGILNIVDDHSRRDLRHKLQIVARQKKSETAEFVLSRGGIKKYFLISLNPLWHSTTDNYYIYGFIKDITEMKNLQNQLENEKNYNRNIIETVKLGFVLVDDNNRYLDYNKEYLELLGRDASELKYSTFYDFTLPEYREEQIVLMKEMIRTLKPFIYEKELVRKDGARLPVILSMSRLLGKDGTPIGNFAFIRDISDQKKSERELIEQNIRFQNLIEIYNSISARYLVCETVNDVYKSFTDEINKIIGPDAIEILTSDGQTFKTAFSINPVTRSGRSSLDDRVSLVISMLASKKSPLVIKDNFTGLNDEDRTAFPGLLKMK